MLRFTIVFALFFMSIVGNSQTNNQLDSLKNANNYSEYIYVSLDEISKLPLEKKTSAFANLESDLWREAKNENEILANVYLYVNYAYYLKLQGNLSAAVSQYENAYKYYNSTSNLAYDIIEYCLKPLANNYTRLGDYSRAEDILKLSVKRAQEDNNLQHLVSSYKNLAIVKRSTGNYKTAISYLEEALGLVIDFQDKSELYSDVAVNYLLLQEYDKVEQYVELSNKLNTNNDDKIVFQNKKTKGNVFLVKKEFKKASNYFFEAIPYAQNSFGIHNREVAKLYNSIAECFLGTKEYANAEKSYLKAIDVLLPKTSNIADYLYAENTLKESFDGLAKVCTLQNKLEEALAYYNFSFLVEEKIQRSLASQEAKIIQQQEIKNRSELCIELCYELYKNNRDKSWVEKAFQYAEKAKSAVLNEVKSLNYSKSVLAQDSLIIKEKQLLYEKGQLDKTIVVEELKGSKANVNLLANSIETRSNLEGDLLLIEKELVNRYPQIYSSNNEVQLKRIQEKLHENQSLVTFFDGKKYLYRFNLTKNNNLQLIRIPKTESFKNNLTEFVLFFASERGAELQNNITKYASLGFKIYQDLFSKIEAEKLIIIPDGLLNFIPFDALLTKKVKSVNFENLPYLILNSQIQLAYSALIFQQNYSEVIEPKKNEFLGFFPVFETSQRGLSKLSFTINEAENVKKYVNGEVLMKQKATKKAFQKFAKNCEILHLSTHASGGSFNSPPVVEFFDETMFLPEIYGYNIEAKLLVLSACETGLGAVRPGEGALSLARGFSYAGVKNMVVSLWKVNDKATSLLMKYFYENLSKTNNRSLSLHTAKLKYLQSKDINSLKKSPYYWASFTLIGEQEAEYNGGFNYLWIFAFSLLLIVVGFLIKRLVLPNGFRKNIEA